MPKAFNQHYCINYEETLSLVVKISTIKYLIDVDASIRSLLYLIDFNNAFLHDDLFKEVFMKVPEGVPNPDNKVSCMRKSIYELKQASREWFTKLLFSLKDQDYL